jgi:hypothetical protein
MGKKHNRKKAAVSQLQNPLAPSIVTAEVENEPEHQTATVIQPVRELKVHPFEVLLTGARNTGMADGLREGVRMREDLEAQLSELREYIERLEKRERAKDGADTAKAELLPRLEQLTQHVSTLENRLRDEEERHEAEVTVVRKEANVHRHKEIGQRILAKPTNEGTATSREVYICTHPTFDRRESSRDIQQNPWASIAQRHT